MAANPFVQLGISLLLGLLVGLQRQRAGSSIGGIRTFPLIAAFGTVCGLLAIDHGGWTVAAGLIAIAGMLVVSNLMLARNDEPDAGQTTEVAALLLYGIGAYLVFGEMAVAVVLGGVIAVLLHYKDLLHSFAGRFGERDVTAFMQFVLITLVILPVLPNRVYGPYDVLNPFEVWLMVVVIVGIGLVGYVAYKLFGARDGAVLGGLIGGLVSSTATTASFARRTATTPSVSGLAALVVMIAATVVFVRVLVEIAVVAPAEFRQIAPPIGVMLAVCVVVSVILYYRTRDHHAAMAEQGNPADLKMALVFGGLYALVVFAAAAANAEFGHRGLYVVALLSGLTDMDAITLSTSQLVAGGRLDSHTGWRMILMAALSNLAFKGILVATLGNRELLKRVALAFGTAIVAGGALLWFWPAQGA